MIGKQIKFTYNKYMGENWEEMTGSGVIVDKNLDNGYTYYFVEAENGELFKVSPSNIKSIVK